MLVGTTLAFYSANVSHVDDNNRFLFSFCLGLLVY